MNSKKKYTKPYAVNLSGFRVIGSDNAQIGGGGYEPLGICIDGSYPASSCDTGISPGSGSACTPAGGMPEQGFCQSGSTVAAGCSQGSIPS